MATLKSGDILQSLFNQSACSDIMLSFNSVQYFLISNVIKELAPALLSEVTVPKVISLSTGDDKAVQDLTTYLVQTICNKKLITITDPTISDFTVKAVLEHLYGKSLEGLMTVDNAHEFFALNQRFGGIESVKNHFDKVIKDLPNDKFVTLFLKPMAHVIPCVSLSEFVRRFSTFTPSELELYIPQLSFEMMIQLLSSNGLEFSENTIFHIANIWCKVHSDNPDNCSKVMTYVKLEQLAPKILTIAVKSCPYIKFEHYLEALEKTVITRVHSNHKFAIGKVEGQYAGYRLVTKKDIEDGLSGQVFTDFYVRSNGLPSLDTFTSEIVVGEDFELKYDDWFVRTSLQNVNKLDVVKFYTRNMNASQIMCNTKLFEYNNKTDTNRSEKLTGLFMSN